MRAEGVASPDPRVLVTPAGSGGGTCGLTCERRGRRNAMLGNPDSKAPNYMPWTLPPLKYGRLQTGSGTGNKGARQQTRGRRGDMGDWLSGLYLLVPLSAKYALHITVQVRFCRSLPESVHVLVSQGEGKTQSSTRKSPQLWGENRGRAEEILSMWSFRQFCAAMRWLPAPLQPVPEVRFKLHKAKPLLASDGCGPRWFGLFGTNC